MERIDPMIVMIEAANQAALAMFGWFFQGWGDEVLMVIGTAG